MVGQHQFSLSQFFYNAASQIAVLQSKTNDLKILKKCEESLPPLNELTEIEQSLSDLLTEQEKQPPTTTDMSTARQQLIVTLHSIKDKKKSQDPERTIDLESRLSEANRNWQRAAAAWIKGKDTKERPSFAVAYYIQRHARQKLTAARARQERKL